MIYENPERCNVEDILLVEKSIGKFFILYFKVLISVQTIIKIILFLVILCDIKTVNKRIVTRLNYTPNGFI